MTQSTSSATGFYSIHANRLEDLRALVVKICSAEPLAPLQNEMCLVQSNGIAQWLKLGLAQPPEDGGLGIAAGFNFSLPSTFIWRAYRAVLSTDAVPDQSSLDKDILIWRLFRLLDAIFHHPDRFDDHANFAPLLTFLQGDSPQLRRFQLAERIALLFDQYQVYRADWLEAWQSGQNVIKKGGREQALPQTLLWQPQLWRLLLQDAGESQSTSSRASVHQRFMLKAQQIDTPVHPELLPKRIIVFGISAMPQQILEALQMISKFTRVVFCVANPCQYYWGDIVSERDVIVANKQRANKRIATANTDSKKPQRVRNDQQAQLADLPVEELHQQANPLLASLGKQGRDYIRLLEAFDGSYQDQVSHAHLAVDRIDVFTPYAQPDANGYISLLNQIQNDIFDLTPIDELLSSQRVFVPGIDNSLMFHEVHSEQRELEVLHDQLLHAFNQDEALKPSDVLVMTPDINKYAPHINAVFGLYDRRDKRFIPFTISDQGLRDQDPNVIAFEQLLSLDKSRFTYTDVMSLLELPAISDKFELTPQDLDIVKRWTQGSNVRWGLDAKHREQFVPTADLHMSTWQAGLRAMLLGYSMPNAGQWGTEIAYDEIGGLEVKVIGNLIEFIDALKAFKQVLDAEHTAQQWQAHIQAALDTFFADTQLSTLAIKSEIGKQTDKLVKNLMQAESSAQRLPISTVKDLLLDGLDGATLNHRFLMGSVNFATLMPMRAIPFKKVYILGMNDGDFPRHNKPVDFDLMANDYRPGDRSMREDDRYLFLEALLAARESLYISWVGRSIKDDSERPPSLLVSQLRDYVNKFWQLSEVDEHDANVRTDADATVHQAAPVQTASEMRVTDTISCVHPLQPFSEKYFQPSQGLQNTERSPLRPPALFSYASEWRQAKSRGVSRIDGADAANTSGQPDTQSIAFIAPEQPLNLADLSRFMKKPVETFFKRALLINFDEAETLNNDRETFSLSGLQQYSFDSQLIDRAILPARDEHALGLNIDREIRALTLSGAFGLASTASNTASKIRANIETLGARYLQYRRHLHPLDKKQVDIAYSIDAAPNIRLGIEATVGEFWQSSSGELNRLLVCKSKTKGTKHSDKMRYDNLISPWLEHLACHALGERFTTRALAKETKVSFVFRPLSAEQAGAYLNDILSLWMLGMQRPLPLHSRVGFSYVAAMKDKPDMQEEERQLLMQSLNKELDSQLVYDNGYYRRAFGDTITLVNSLEFAHLSSRLYLPLVKALEEFDDE
jgi:exodeoxyribonuclease V gamma subunit